MNKLDLTKLQNAEHLSFISDVLLLLNALNIEVLNEVKTKLAENVTKEELAQKEIKKSEHTKSLIELDKERDYRYRGLLHRLKAELFSPLSSSILSAEKLMIVFNTYGNITEHNYQKEATEIDNLIADLRTEHYLADVTALGLEQWVNWLEEANNNFKEIYSIRRDEYADRPDYNMREIRKESDELFKRLHELISALKVLQPSQELSEFIAKVNVSIDKWKDILALRRGKKNKEEVMTEPLNEEETA